MSKEVTQTTLPDTNALSRDALLKELKKQLEYYFSPENLTNDTTFVSHMNAQMYIPLEIVMDQPKIKELTQDKFIVIEAMENAMNCALNDTKDAIKPNVKSQRNTIIIREIPSSTAPEEVKAIFEGCGTVKNVRSDVGDTWFVTMETEEDAVNSLLALRSKNYNGAPIKARLKSENTLKAFYPSQKVTEPAQHVDMSYNRGYYAQASAGTQNGYYNGPNNNRYGVQYNMPNYNNSNNDSSAVQDPVPGRGGRGTRGGRGSVYGRGAFYNQNTRGPSPNNSRVKSSTADDRNLPKKGSNKRFTGPGAKQSETSPSNARQVQGHANANADSNSKKNTTTEAKSQPILSTMNFPPLPTANKGDTGTNDKEIRYKYTHDDIIEIVKHMDDNDCMLPPGRVDFIAHDLALTETAHPDLLRNQRTYSIEQAREAMRQGRPIRSDSVGSMDYESMMYGEDYTKMAREQRKLEAEKEEKEKKEKKANSETEVQTSAQSVSSNKPIKIVGYAAAVILGAPAAPADKSKAAPPKKKTPATNKDKKGKDPEKKNTHHKTNKNKSEKKAINNVPVPVVSSGAWGGRNFLDVVKSDPIPTSASTSQTPASDGIKKESPAVQQTRKDSSTDRPKKTQEKVTT